jgi:hypothetical protein
MLIHGLALVESHMKESAVLFTRSCCILSMYNAYTGYKSDGVSYKISRWTWHLVPCVVDRWRNIHRVWSKQCTKPISMGTGESSCYSTPFISIEIQRQCLILDDYLFGPHVIANRHGGIECSDFLGRTYALTFDYTLPTSRANALLAEPFSEHPYRPLDSCRLITVFLTWTHFICFSGENISRKRLCSECRRSQHTLVANPANWFLLGTLFDIGVKSACDLEEVMKITSCDVICRTVCESPLHDQMFVLNAT